MSKFKFEKATKRQAKARVATVGPSGSGKTMTSLILATTMCSRVAFIDTEHGSASKYAPKDGEKANGRDTFEFDTLNLTSFSPADYAEAIHEAESQGFDGVVIDSLSHAWMGKDGALEQADKASARHGENRFTAWRHVTPQHNALIEAIVGCKAHLFATMRSKTEYVIEDNEKGKKVPRKIGMAPVQRDGMEYEFDLVADMDHNHNFVVTKSRCSALADAVINKPGAELAHQLMAWLGDGSPPALTPVQRLLADIPLASSSGQLDAVKAQARDLWTKASKPEQAQINAAIETATKELQAGAA